MFRKVIFYILLIITLFTGPWWIFGLLYIAGFILQEEQWYIGLLIGFSADILTNANTVISMKYSIVGIGLFLFFLFFRSQIRIPKIL
jgi:hypothetical protein